MFSFTNIYQTTAKKPDAHQVIAVKNVLQILQKRLTACSVRVLVQEYNKKAKQYQIKISSIIQNKDRVMNLDISGDISAFAEIKQGTIFYKHKFFGFLNQKKKNIKLCFFLSLVKFSPEVFYKYFQEIRVFNNVLSFKTTIEEEITSIFIYFNEEDIEKIEVLFASTKMTIDQITN